MDNIEEKDKRIAEAIKKIRFEADIASKKLKDTADNTSAGVLMVANTAAKDLAETAQTAMKVITDATAVALKVNNNQNSNDHDSIVKVLTLLEVVDKTLTEIKVGTSKQIDDHEKRIFNIEKSKSTQTILISIGIALLSLSSGVIIYHIQQPIPDATPKTTIIYQETPAKILNKQVDSLYNSTNAFKK